MSGRFAGKTCVVTGASRGLGRHVAERLWAEGASLVLGCRTPESVAALRRELPPSPQRSVLAVELDLADTASVRSFVDRASSAGASRLDVLVSCAAVLGPVGPAWEVSPLEWEAAVVADLVAPALLCASMVRAMKAAGGGRIVNLSGGGATGPRPAFSAYAAAKAGIVRFSETLAEEVKGLGITVNCVAPGVLDTDMLAEVERLGAGVAGEKELAAVRKARADGARAMQRAVDLVTFLASDESGAITGKLISAPWDDWAVFPAHAEELARSDVYTLRRIVARERGFTWGDK